MFTHNRTDSEEIYKIAVEEASILTALYTGPDIRITVANRLMLRAWGKDESVIGRPIREALPELHGQPFFEYFDQVYQSGIEHNSQEELAYLLVNGEYQAFYYDYNYKPLKKSDGSVWGIVHTAIDVTDKVNAKKAIKRSDDMLHLAVESAGLGTWFLDANSKALETSTRTKELFGYNSFEIMPLNAAVNQITEEYRERIVNAIDNAISTGGKLDIEYPVNGFHDGKLRWLRVTGRLYEHSDKGAAFLAGTILDITDRKINEQRKDEFISVASHELKTPLTSLIAGYQLLDRHINNETNLSDKLSKISASTRINLKKLSTLVEDLLSVTKIENGQLKLNKKWFTISESIDECCDHIRLQNEYDLVVTGDLKARAFADQQKIDQAIVNFVNNAVKYAPKSKIINMMIETFPDKVKISVQDFGVGIETHKLKQIFNRFYQVDNANFESFGLGLGLYICKEIIEQHNGEIGVESEVGLGSTFWFSLPLIV